MSGSLTIVQLYPDELGVAGDRGNVLALRARLEHAGIETEVVEHRVGDEFPRDADVVLVGNGPLSAMRNILDDLRGISGRLVALADSGAPFFAYGSGAELLGAGITLLDGSRLEGVGIFPFSAVRTTERKVGYVVEDTPFGRLAGFEDNASLWQLAAAAVPFGRLVAGGGNGDGRHEGVRLGDSIATQLGGPALPLNPILTDALLTAAATRKGIVYARKQGDAKLDKYADQARQVIIANAKHVFSRI
jgi:CobQ-like glutamine amidotransferase family enzyme